MTENAPTTPPRSRRWPIRCRAALLVLVLTTAVCPAAVATSEGGPSRWAGYRIPSNGRADGGWIGGYRLDGAPMFLTTPSRRPNRRGFEEQRIVEDLKGARGPSRRESVRAAWTLSKYGGYRDATQAAAVDAVVYHLLAGRKWQITHQRAHRRIRASGDPASVRRFARIMLRQSRASAGAYGASVTALGADVGGTVAGSVTVTDGRGRPAAGLPVTFAFPGAEPVEAVTGDDGRAVARFPADRGGWQELTATVQQVPEHRLYLHPPVKKRQASAAEGGVRRTVVVSTLAAVRGQQSLSLKAVDDEITVGAPAAVTANVTGDGVSRPVVATLHGPFATAAAVSCSAAEVGRVSASVSVDGTYQLPAVEPAASGYYAWSVSIAGTDTSTAVSACGAATVVKAVAEISVTAQELAFLAGNVAHVRVALRGLPRTPAILVTATLWGPYPNENAMRTAGCSGNLRLQDQKRMNGDGAELFDVYVDTTGWYAWQAEVPPGELREGSRSQCLAPNSMLEAR